jgi:hypothetical protein
MQKEIWKEIKGYEGLYEVSNLGNVKSLERNIVRKDGTNFYIAERILRPSKDRKGYLNIGLYKKGKSKNYKVHRLVAAAFIPNPESKLEVNHINADKADNRVKNLEWATCKENVHHAIKAGLITTCSANNKRSKPVAQYDENNILIATYPSMREAARQTGIYQSDISRCCNKEKNHKTAGGFIWAYAD